MVCREEVLLMALSNGFVKGVCPMDFIKWFVLWILLMVCPMDFVNGLSYGFC